MATTVCASALLTALAYLPFWEGRATFQSFGTYSALQLNSPSLIAIVIIRSVLKLLPIGDATVMSTLIVQIACIAIFTAIWFRYGRWGSSGLGPLFIACYMSLFAFLFLCAWQFQPWYFILLISFIPFLTDSGFRMHAVVCSITSILNTLAYYYWAELPQTTKFESTLRGVAIIWGVPVIIYVWLVKRDGDRGHASR